MGVRSDMRMDVYKKTISDLLDEIIDIYGQKFKHQLDPKLIKILKEFVFSYGDLLVASTKKGGVDHKQIAGLLISKLKLAGVVADLKMIECAVGIFELGVTGLEWTQNTIKTGAWAQRASVFGPQAALVGGSVTALVALFGVFVTVKDSLSVAKSCNEALSAKAAKEKRPEVFIGGKGYSLGQMSTGFFSNTDFGIKMVCST